IAAIGNRRTQPIANSLIANVFFHLCDAAQFQLRGAPRFFRRHTGPNVFVRQHLEMALNLLAEICFNAVREEEVSCEASKSDKQRHEDPLSRTLAKLAR